MAPINRIVFAASLAMLFAFGCGGQRPDYGSLELCEVTGVVRLDDAPLAGATVRFVNEDGTFSEGVTDSSGQYRLRYKSEQSGIARGPKIARIYSKREFDGEAQGTEQIDAQCKAESKFVRTMKIFDFDVKRAPARNATK